MISYNRDSVPNIAPVPTGIHRPFWSVMIPTYNCVNYLVETLKSVLAQDPGLDQMQIEVVDDFSTKDDPEAVVREIGKGRVSFYRQLKNGGAIANFNTCIQRAKGHWIHILHGDDSVLQGFYERLRQGIEQEPNLGAAFCRYIIVDDNSHWTEMISPVERETPGILSNFLAPMAVVNRIMTPSIVVKRSVYEEIGAFHPELFHSADWDMWKRIILNYPIWFEPQVSACYRLHSSSDSSRLKKSGDNITEACRAIEIAETYLPALVATELSNAAREAHAFDALENTKEMLEKGNLEVVIAQLRAAIKCSHSTRIFESLNQILPILFRLLYNNHLLPFVALDKFLSEAQFLAILSQDIKEFQAYPNNQLTLAKLQQARQKIAEQWLNLPHEYLQDAYRGELGTAHKMLLRIGIQKASETNMEQEFLESQNLGKNQNVEQGKIIKNILVKMLYFLPATFSLKSELSIIPHWFITDYLTFLFGSSYFYKDKAEVEKYHFYQQQWIQDLYDWFDRMTDVYISRNVANSILETASFVPPENAIKDVYIKYKKVLQKVLHLKECEVTHKFAEHFTDRKKIKIGILAATFADKPNTWKTLPVYEYLSREFEVTLYALSREGSYLERYCASCASDFIVLPEGLAHQVDVIRSADLDILVITGDSSAITNCIYLLSFHQLARIQVATATPLSEMAISTIDHHLSLKEPQLLDKIAYSKEIASFFQEKLRERELSLLRDRLHLREINFIIFPDWSQPEELLCQEFIEILRNLSTHTLRTQMTLLVDTSNIAEDEAELLFYSVVMNLMMDEDIAIDEELQISFIGHLSKLQWESLLSSIQERIPLVTENKEAIIAVCAESIPVNKEK
ncbi:MULTISPECIES: glycosyltransferase [Nostocales]|uniref:Glycosyltransferase n=3 Tax=Nostocales TaxID=1161 RepID=A0A8S9T4B7_9CYAN|nr:glycosyltransferase [Tolypothrix bouteillei]KAF3886313.1 glycosyltransferase [Tolypothrix bouteillei VB521301]